MSETSQKHRPGTSRRKPKLIAAHRKSARAVDGSRLVAGGGEIGKLIASRDWSRTPLGAMATWPQSLRTAIGMMLESRFGMVVAWGAEFRFFYNDRYRPVLGETKHPGALGSPAKQVFPEAWPFLGPLFNQTRAGKSVALDDQLVPLDRNGYLENCYFTFSYSPIRDEGGGVGGMLAVVAETTERVLAERRLGALRDLLRAAADAKTPEAACTDATGILAKNLIDVPFALLYLVAEDGKTGRLVSTSGVIPGNPACPDRLDLTSDQAQSWPVARAVASGKLDLVTDVGKRFGPLPAGPYPEPTHTAVIVPLARPGQQHPTAVLIAGVSPRRAFDDAYQGFFNLAADHILTALTNARAFQDERERAEALAEINRAKTAFFSNVSHEFRTPLTLMLGPAEDLLAGLHGELAPAQREQVDFLHRGALRLQKLVNALLDFSRIEAGRLQACYEPVDLAALTRDVASGFRSAVEKAGLTFKVTCLPLGVPIYVDRGMWENIVLNLISNAFKFTFDGGIEIALRATSDEVVLRVTDTGVGVPAEELPRIFERFHRIEGTRARTHEGSGIGLALVQELVALHGGTVRAKSLINAGTELTVTIPQGKAHLPEGRIGARGATASTPAAVAPFIQEALGWLPTEGRAAVPATGSAPPAPARILLADDNADLRHYVRRLLEPHFTVEAVEDGIKALAAARARPPDLIITDVMMPGLDGFALLAELRQIEATSLIPVVMLSARAGEEARVEGLQAGAEDYLVKPFAARELIARVRTHLELARLRKERERRIEELGRAVRFSEIFVGVLSHDLRNPLHAISTSASLLSRRAKSEAIATPVSRVLVGAERMGRMIDQLLDFSRIRLGRGFPIEREMIDLSELCRLVVADLRRAHRCKVKFERVGNFAGFWDRERLSQLLSNLVGNACQHRNPGTQVLLRVDGTNTGSVAFEVRNKGAIPENLLPVILDPLHVAAGGKRREGGRGLGLGLYISQQIVVTHGGVMRVESSAARGTRVVVDLPRRMREPVNDRS